MWGFSLKQVGFVQVVIVFMSFLAQANGEVAAQAVRTLLRDEGVYSIFSKTSRGKAVLEAVGLVPSAAIATDRALNLAFRERLISIFQYRQSEALAEKLLPRLQETQKALLDQAGALQKADEGVRERILSEISDKTFGGNELDEALSLAKRPLLKHNKGPFKGNSDRAFGLSRAQPDNSPDIATEEPASMIAAGSRPMSATLSPTALTAEEVILVERGGLLQRLKLDFETLRLFRLKGIDVKIARFFAQNFIPSLRSTPVIFTPEEVWLFRKVVGAMGGYNTYSKFISRMQVFAERINPEVYSQLNNSDEAILAAREFMAEKIDIPSYIAKRMKIAETLHIDKNFEPIVWKVEEEMLQSLATCKRLGQFNEAVDSGLGPLEIVESNTQSLRSRIFKVQNKIKTTQARIQELKSTKSTLTSDEKVELNQAEIDRRTYAIDERDLTQQLYLLQRATNFQKLYWEFTQNYEALIWGNLHEGQLANLRVQPIDIAEPFLIPQSQFEGTWAALYRRGLINAADPLASEEMVTMFKTLLGNVRMLYQDLNKLTGGKFAETNLGKQMNQYQDSLPRVLIKQILKYGAPAGIITEEILRRWLFDDEGKNKDKDKDKEDKKEPATDQTTPANSETTSTDTGKPVTDIPPQTPESASGSAPTPATAPVTPASPEAKPVSEENGTPPPVSDGK